jgi:6,7-dimethyl-8-ribityllumazine synthase
MDDPTALRLPSDVRIAFVQSGWHHDLVDRCRRSFVDEMATFGVTAERIDVFSVPGSFEVPLMAKRLAGCGRYNAIVGSGLVVDGGIYRHEFVADAVLNGLMRVQLDTDVPIISAVLTPHHFHEHSPHAEFFADHLTLKGVEAARACARTVDNMIRVPA